MVNLIVGGLPWALISYWREGLSIYLGEKEKGDA